jgi:MYXO-CTERM domain-containing protein
MSALLSSTEAETPVRFGRTRAVLAVLVVVGTLASLVANCARTLTNTDTYFHLRFGQEFLDGWSLRHPGSVSTFATRDWVPTQWLSEIVMARTEDWFGLAGVAWLSGLLEIALFLTLYVVCRDRAEPLVAAALTATALYAMQNGLSMRPQVISYLLVAVVVGAWLRTARDGRIRWWLVPLVWVWAMLHGMWPIAVVIGAAAVLGLALDRAPRRLLVRAAAVPVASAVVAAVTPVGPELYPAVAAVGSRSQYFAEWGSPDWTSWEYGALALLLVLTGLAMWRRRRSSWLEVVLVALAVAFAVYSERTVPVAAAMIAPLLAGPLQDLLGRRTPVDRRERLVVGGGALAALVVLAVAVPFTSADPPREAASMEAAVAALPPGTKVLDDWGQGGYVMWRYPQLDLMMHGYGDTFTTDELRRNTELIVLGPGWEESLHESGARVALLRPWSRLAVVLRAQGWRTVQESDDYVLLRASATWQSDGPAVAPGLGSGG